MTLSRWRRVVTGVAAGLIVLLAALIGASFNNDNGGVSIASELRPQNVIPIEEDPVETGDTGDSGDTAVETTADTTDSASTDDAADDTDTAVDSDDGEADSPVDTDDVLTDPVTVIETDDLATADEPDQDEADSPVDESTDDAAGSPQGAPEGESTDAGETASTDTTPEQAPTATPVPPAPAATPVPPAPAPQPPAAPLPANDGSLGTGGGVNDAECALDRLVIYAGARQGGVAGSIRAALAQAGFGAGCPSPVTVLASNCPLQFSGVLGAGSGYDPNQSFVASNANVDRATLSAVMSTVGYSGSQINILDFGFVNPDRPGEQWMAIFIPPSFEGWQNLAARAGVSPTASSLCAPSGQLAG